MRSASMSIERLGMELEAPLEDTGDPARRVYRQADRRGRLGAEARRRHAGRLAWALTLALGVTVWSWRRPAPHADGRAARVAREWAPAGVRGAMSREHVVGSAPARAARAAVSGTWAGPATTTAATAPATAPADDLTAAGSAPAPFEAGSREAALGDAPSAAMVAWWSHHYRALLRAFATDVEATGMVPRERAQELAATAVRTAWAHGLPPVLLFGIMRVENDRFSPTARSRAGALGLVQVMPEHARGDRWGRYYGTDLRRDATNLGIGSAILRERLLARRDIDAALLDYNGCRGKLVTARCLAYPRLVRRAVERDARALCPPRSFAICVEWAMRHAPRADGATGRGSAGLNEGATATPSAASGREAATASTGA